MGQYALRSVGTMAAGTGTLVPGMPAGWQAGDLLLMMASCVSTSETFAAIAGWTPIAATAGNGNLRLLARVAQAGDTAPSASWSGTSAGCAQIAAFSGDVVADLATIVAHVATKESVATRPKIWGLTVTTANCLIITMSRIVKTSASNGTTYNSPTASITELGEYEATGTNIAAVWGYQMQTAAANVAEASWTPQGTAEPANVSFLALTVALKTSGATVSAQGSGVTDTASAPGASAQGGSGSVAAQGEGATAVATATLATVDTGIKQTIVVSGSPSSNAVSLKTLFSPPAVDGDVFVVDKATTPGGYVVTVASDGTFRFDSGGDESRQIIDVDLIQASNGVARGAGYVVVNNRPPELISSSFGFFPNEPILPFVPLEYQLSRLIRDPEGDDTLTFELLAGPLPNGLRLTRAGRLHGTPIAIGSYPITIRVTDAFGAFADISDTIIVAYSGVGAGVTVAASAPDGIASVTVSASGAGVTDAASAPTATADGGAVSFDFYISPTGSDSNPGTLAQPWAITALNTKQETYAGNAVGLLDGTYNIYGMSPLTQGFPALLQIRNGSASGSTVIAAVNTGAAIIKANNGSSYPFTDCALMGDYGSLMNGYIEIRGLVFEGGACKGIYLGDHVASNQATGGRGPGYVVKDCEFRGWDCRGVAGGGNYGCVEITGGISTQIHNNYLHDNIGRALGTSDHWAGIMMWHMTDVSLLNNTLINSGGIYHKEDYQRGADVGGNYVDATSMPDCAGIQDFVGSTTDTVGTTKVHHNVIIAVKYNDMRPTLGTNGFRSNVEFFNNVVVATAESSVGYGLLLRVVAGKAKVFNNIVVMTTNSGDTGFIALNTDAGLCDYNLYHCSAGASSWKSFPSVDDNNRTGHAPLSDWQSDTGFDEIGRAHV